MECIASARRTDDAQGPSVENAASVPTFPLLGRGGPHCLGGGRSAYESNGGRQIVRSGAYTRPGVQVARRAVAQSAGAWCLTGGMRRSVHDVHVDPHRWGCVRARPLGVGVALAVAV